MNWIHEIDISDLLTGDLQLIKNSCGAEIAVALMERLPKTNLYISEKPLYEAKRRYIRQKFNGGNVKELARILRVSEQFVYNTINQRASDPQPDLFGS